MKHIRRAQQLLGFHSQADYLFGAPKEEEENMVSVCLFLAHHGIMQPGIWNLFKEEFTEFPENGKLAFIVHCPPTHYDSIERSLDATGWEHVCNIGMKYNEHTGWCKMSLVTVQLQCYFHILNHFGRETKGTVYLVSGYDIPIAPPNDMVAFTRSQLDCRSTKRPHLQWLALTFKTIKSILDLCKKPTQDVQFIEEALLLLAPPQKKLTPSYLADKKSHFLMKRNGSFYEFIVYLRNEFFYGEESIDFPFPCPDEVLICDILLKHVDPASLSNVDNNMPWQTADPRSLSPASPIEFGIADSDHKRDDVLTNRYFNMVIIPHDYNSFPGIGNVAIPMTTLDYMQSFVEDSWPDRWNKKVPDMPRLGLAQFGLEMHVLAAIASGEKKQPLFFRKVTSNGNVTRSNFLKMLITNNGSIQIKKNIRPCAPFLMELKTAFEKRGEGELNTLITNARTLSECIELEKEEKLFANDEFEVFTSHRIRNELQQYVFSCIDEMKKHMKMFREGNTDQKQFEEALKLDIKFRKFLSTYSRKRKHPFEPQA